MGIVETGSAAGDTPQMIMLNPMQQQRLWEGMIGAEVRSLYFAELTRRYHVTQRVVTWFTLVASSGALVSILANKGGPWVPSLLALITSGLSLYSLVATNERMATEASALHLQWNRLAIEYRQLWENMYVEDALDRLNAIEDRAADLSRLGASFPVIEKSLLKWQDRVEKRLLAVATAVHA